MRRIIIWGGGALLLVGLLAWSFRPRPVPADIGQVTRGPLAVHVVEDGETRVREVYLLSAPIGGRLMRIEARAGDRVVANETVLARILPADPALLDVRSRTAAESRVAMAESALTLARAEVRRAEAQLDYDRAELARVQTLRAGDVVALARLDRARLAVETSSAALATATAALGVKQSELDAAKAELIEPGEADRLAAVEVRAPVSGQVLRRVVESEQVVQPGQPLLEIGDPADLEIVADLLSVDAVKVSPGDAVEIVDWGGDRRLAGQVRRVEPFGFTKVSALGIEEQRVNVLVDFTGDPAAWTRLGHGYRVELRIRIWHSDDTLKLPVSALFRQNGQWTAFELKDGKAHPVALEIDRLNDQEAQLLSGLDEGARVILHPGDSIADGTAIAARASQ